MKFKLTIYPAFEVGDLYIISLFETKKELIAARNTSADLLLFLQDKAKLMDDYSNMFICEQKINNEWEDVE